MTSGDFHTDLSENITAVVSNVIIESNSMFFSRFSIPCNFYLEGVVILTPTLILATMGKVAGSATRERAKMIQDIVMTVKKIRNLILIDV